MALVITSFDQALKLSQAAGRDAGERSRRNAGRDTWNEDDWNTACEAQRNFLVMCGCYGTVLPSEAADAVTHEE